MCNAQNPFFEVWETPHATVPFSKIKTADYPVAVDRALEIARAEIEAIAKNPEAPTFENTIVALEGAGKDLDRVVEVFDAMDNAISDDEMMAVSNGIYQKLTEYSTEITLNEDLWKRVKSVYDNRANLTLDKEDQMLLKRTYDSFANQGATLQGADREKFKALTAELSELTTKFGQNVLKELYTYEIWLNKDDLAGLPESSIEAAALAAKEKGREGEYLFTLAQPTYMAFLKYSSRPDLREKMYRLYNGRNMKGEYSNIEVLKRIAEVRMELAKLLGKENYASKSLANTMAHDVDGVYGLLNQLVEAYRPAQIAEIEELTKFASEYEGHPVTLNAWDYSYYSNKLKEAKYNFNEEEFRPYFELNNVIDGVFGLATKLYGLTFTENPEIQKYHPDVKVYDVTGPEGEYIGVIYTDFFPRESKRPGAWMTGLHPQSITNGVNDRPHVSIVMNFTKPTADKPALLTPYEVETFLHEFGHALHGLLANTKYSSLSGTSVYRDFVELPSQFNENYLTEKEFLDTFAKHYQTGETIPQSMVDKLIASQQYGAAYACVRQLNFGLLDMAWHTITAPVDDPVDFEVKALERVQIFPVVDGTMISPQFSHIFSGGYAAGYYSYKWSEVLDADAFAHFKAHGIFNPEIAKSFKDNVLTRGGTEDPAELYRRFRGQDPTIDALLIRDGIKKAEK